MGTIKNNSPLSYFIIGPQGSGKGTQSRLICQKYKLHYISSGDLLRNISKQNTSIGKQIKQTIDQGKLIPDQLLMDLIKAEIVKSENKSGFLIDGVPRTEYQLHALDKIFSDIKLPSPLAIAIEIPEDESLKRISSRKICSKCQTPLLPSQSNEITSCPLCQGEIVTRRDDSNIESIKSRLDQYYKSTAPLLDFFKKNNRLIKINGQQSVEDVTREIFSKL